jgi:hydrogenase maturation protein HypF
MKPPPVQPATRCRWAITVRGVVQGVGFRPFVYNAARRCGLTGWVQNRSGTVCIEAEGEQAKVEELVEAIRHAPPPQARIDAVEVQVIPCGGPAGQEDGPAAGFAIRASQAAAAPRPTIPADLATCDLCLAEIHDPAQRRWRYPFTNCTNCGPRWSIIRQLPYDRPRTSMAEFALCPACAAEYTDPSDRRFHAQPIACPRCGPALELLDGRGQRLAVETAALEEAVRALLDGRVVAMKGLGGFQLLVDATNAAAVDLLRRRKQRPDRPFALMFPTLDDVRRHCELSAEEARGLQSPQAPILLLRRRQAAGLVEGVAPGNPCLGVMLPYTPLHHLLLEAAGRPLVCTSGNLSEEPMAISTAEALGRLGSGDCRTDGANGPGIADLFLVHDRPIVRPVDDSVARLDAEGLQVLRRARGYAPLPIALAISGPTTLAAGGHLKNTVALALGSPSEPLEVVLSPHGGDLDSLLGVEVFRRAIDDLVDFFAVTPEAVACDLHPDYASTRHAEALARRWGAPLVRVQHHYAHVAACMAEHGLEGPVLGFAWDGTGYGTDGTIWGGEALVCQRSGFVRLAHLRTFPLPGGDWAMRQPRRSALGLLYEILGAAETEAVLAGLAAGAADWFSPAESSTLLAALARSLHAPRTSSMGRLFDGVAALCGLPRVISFEGQAAMALEFAADAEQTAAYPLPLDEGAPAVADWEPLVRAVLADRAAGVSVGRISARFHNALAGLCAAVAQRAGLPQVVLSGGCFQNALLTDRARRRLSAAGFSVYTHRRVPPGDGGIALGQVLVAAAELKQGSSHVSGHSR